MEVVNTWIDLNEYLCNNNINDVLEGTKYAHNNNNTKGINETNMPLIQSKYLALLMKQ